MDAPSRKISGKSRSLFYLLNSLKTLPSSESGTSAEEKITHFLSNSLLLSSQSSKIIERLRPLAEYPLLMIALHEFKMLPCFSEQEICKYRSSLKRLGGTLNLSFLQVFADLKKQETSKETSASEQIDTQRRLRGFLYSVQACNSEAKERFLVIFVHISAILSTICALTPNSSVEEYKAECSKSFNAYLWGDWSDANWVKSLNYNRASAKEGWNLAANYCKLACAALVGNVTLSKNRNTSRVSERAISVSHIDEHVREWICEVLSELVGWICCHIQPPDPASLLSYIRGRLSILASRVLEDLKIPGDVLNEKEFAFIETQALAVFSKNRLSVL